MEEQRANARKEQCDLDGEPFTVEIGIDQDRDQDRGTEHSEHVLQAENEHFRHPEPFRVVDGSIFLSWCVTQNKPPPLLRGPPMTGTAKLRSFLSESVGPDVKKSRTKCTT